MIIIRETLYKKKHFKNYNFLYINANHFLKVSKKHLKVINWCSISLYKKDFDVIHPWHLSCLIYAAYSIYSPMKKSLQEIYRKFIKNFTESLQKTHKNVLQKIYRKMRLSVFFLYTFIGKIQKRHRKIWRKFVEILQKVNRKFAKFLQET